MGRQGWLARLWGTTCLVLLGVAAAIGWRTLPEAEAGDADPLSAVIGLAALAASVWAGALAVRSLRWQETVLADVAERLATEVRAAEQEARRHLLGGHDKAIDVEFTFCPAPAHDAAGADPEGRLDDVVGYYRRLRPRRMVITGAPGAGKTVLAMQLMLGLLEDRAPEDPVPVRLALASWDTSRPVAEWVAGQLVDAYHLPKAAADALVKARRVLPMLDGLDEMDAETEPGYDSRAGRALRALNAYQQGLDKAELVLTCHSRPYRALEEQRVWAQDAARVEIRPVGETAAQRFLTRRVEDPTRWRAVMEAFERNPGGPLATALSTPWLTVAVTVYEQRHPRTGTYLRDPEALTGAAMDTADAVGEHLLALFIPAATAAHPPPKGASYTEGQVHAWLRELARHLDRNTAMGRKIGGRPLSGTDIVLHELWPLAGSRLPRAATAAMIALIWLAGYIAILAQLPTGFSALQILVTGSVAVLAGLTMLAAWGTIWPEPSRVDLRQLRTQAGWLWLAFGLAGGFVFGFVFGLGLAFGLTVGLTGGLAVGLAFGLTGGLAGLRYVAFLLCTRRWNRRPLPWRLGRFLDWCYDAGLIRVAGIAYQFRHQELQNYLAHQDPARPRVRSQSPA
jgi:NACHT domain